MPEKIEVVYEKGMLRPLGPLPGSVHEHQHLTITIEGLGETTHWLADADPAVRIEDVRQALDGIAGTLAEAVHAERDER